MEDGCCSEIVSASSLGLRSSDTMKQVSAEVEASEVGRKGTKLQDLESLFCSEGFNAHQPKSSGSEEATYQFHFNAKTSQVSEDPALKLNSDILQGREGEAQVLPLDLNAKVCTTDYFNCDGIVSCAQETDKNSYMDEDVTAINLKNPSFGLKPEDISSSARSTGFDLNAEAEEVSSSASQDHFHPCKISDHVRSRDVSESGSTVDPLEEKAALRVWKEMKQNGFLSSSHRAIFCSSRGGIPMPKQRKRKGKQDVLKKNMELARREQVDKFAKLAAPSGLLNNLNPGIINHVRNRKQVHSIIEAIVKTEKLENRSKQLKTGKKGISDMKQMEHGMEHTTSHEDKVLKSLSGSEHTRGHSLSLNKCIPFGFVDKGTLGNSTTLETRVCHKSPYDSQTNIERENVVPTSKLSSSMTKESDISRSTPCEDIASVPSLSVKAATIASQWLGLLHQDIKGRLAALKRSKKKVNAVIHTELPFLISKEFSSNQDVDPSITKNSIDGCFNAAFIEMHRARWSALFDQMEKSLSQEEKDLENWLKQVQEMQFRCEQGLQHVQWNVAHFYKQLVDTSRSEGVDNTERRELDVQAAAASIYSTCNFITSMKNLSCS